MNENALRERIAMHGESMFNRGLTAGSSGNISVRTDDGLLITPTNSSLGRLDPARISKVDATGQHVAGDKPSKEAFLHLAMYEQRPTTEAVVHLHSTHAVAVSCLADVSAENVLPPLTAYYVMRVGRLPLVPYYRPGDERLAEAVRDVARDHGAMLLANHGPTVAGSNLDAAVYAMEELEETAKLYLMLKDERTRPLTSEQVREINEHFPT